MTKRHSSLLLFCCISRVPVLMALVIWIFSIHMLSAQVIPKSYNNIKRSNNIDNSDTVTLDDVLIEVPYGKVKRQTFVGAAASIKQKDISNRVATSFVNKLDGQVPGFQLGVTGRPGSSSGISIRGGSSISSGSQPLIILNGMQYGGGLSSINSDDIENIEVLKDASATALYGSRAANGVILITTKTGKSLGRKFSVSVHSSWGTNMRFIPEEERANPEQYYEIMWDVLRNNKLSSYLTKRQNIPAEAFKKAGDDASSQLISSLGNYNIYDVPNEQVVLSDGKINPNAKRVFTPEDWSKAFLQTKLRSENTISVQGSTEDGYVNYYISGNYLKDPGIIVNSDFDRYGFLANVDVKLNRFVKVGTQMNYRYSEHGNALGGGSQLSDAFNTSRNMPLIYPVFVYNPKTGQIITDPQTGKPIYDFGTGFINSETNEFYRNGGEIPSSVDKSKLIQHTRPNFSNSNSIAVSYLDVRNSKLNEFSGRAFVDFNILPGLTFRSNAGLDFSYTEQINNQNSQFGDAAGFGRTIRTTFRQSNINLSQVLNYHHSFGLNNFQATAGHEILLLNQFSESGSRKGFPVPRLNELSAGATVEDASSTTNLYRLQGIFLRLSYDFNNRYFLEGSVRGDQSSVFAPGRQWGAFYSIGGGWNLDREWWFNENFPVFNTFKLKASWGITGNDGAQGGLGFYRYQATYGLDFADLDLPGAIQDKIATPDIRWEKVGKTNIGLEMGFLHNRLHVNIDGFYNPVSDMLFFRPIAPSITGLSGIYQNIGSMFNAGVEWSVKGVVINPAEDDGFRLELGLNGFWRMNRVTKLPEENEKTGLISGSRKYTIGGSIYDFYVRKFKGFDEFGNAIFLEKTGNKDSKGKLIFLKDHLGKPIYDKDGNPAIENQRDTTTINGNNASFYIVKGVLPIMTGAINTTLSFKGIELYFLFKYRIGGKIWDSNYGNLMGGNPSFGDQVHAELYKNRATFSPSADNSSYSVDSRNGKVPLLGTATGLFANASSDRFLVDASYFMFKNITLSYSLPRHVVSLLRMQKLSLFFSVENVFVLSHLRKGGNPEASGGLSVGLTYPTLRSMIGGVKFEF